MDKPSIDNEKSLLSLQEVFRLVGDQLNARDVRVLKFMFSGIFTTEFLNQISDGFSFLQALEKIDRIDESNFRTLEHYLRIINRHDLFQYLTLRRRKTVRHDPVNEYLEQTSASRGILHTNKCRHKCDSCDRAFSKHASQNTTPSNTSPSGTGSSQDTVSRADDGGSQNTKSEDEKVPNTQPRSREHSVSEDASSREHSVSDQTETASQSAVQPTVTGQSTDTCAGSAVGQKGSAACSMDTLAEPNQSLSAEPSKTLPGSIIDCQALAPLEQATKSKTTTSDKNSTNPISPDSSNVKRRSVEFEGSPGPSKRLCTTDCPTQQESTTPTCAVGSIRQTSVGKNGAKRTRRSLGEAPARRSERLKRQSVIGGEEMDTLRVVTAVEPASPTSTPGNLTTSAVTGSVTPTSDETKKKITCDIRLRVRAEYCSHESALQGNVHSNKPEQVERQFEKFMQANTILRSRDLGSIICDIKFSELTYLDAFWRDYINGSLLEALKGVFITEPLKQAVGHEAIKLIVNVDEDDYETGRLVLLRNLQQTTT